MWAPFVIVISWNKSIWSVFTCLGCTQRLTSHPLMTTFVRSLRGSDGSFSVLYFTKYKIYRVRYNSESLVWIRLSATTINSITFAIIPAKSGHRNEYHIASSAGYSNDFWISYPFVRWSEDQLIDSVLHHVPQAVTGVTSTKLTDLSHTSQIV